MNCGSLCDAAHRSIFFDINLNEMCEIDETNEETEKTRKNAFGNYDYLSVSGFKKIIKIV